MATILTGEVAVGTGASLEIGRAIARGRGRAARRGVSAAAATIEAPYVTGAALTADGGWTAA